MDAGPDNDAGYPPTYYVSPTGDDGNPGTLSLPWLTVGMVNAQALPPGSTVLFQGGGTWTESLAPSTSGDAGAVITFSTYGTGRATLDGTTLGTNGVSLISRSYLSLSNLEVKSDPSGFCIYLQGVDHLTFNNLDIHDCAEGVHASRHRRV